MIPTTRFPGYDEKWVNVPLGDIVSRVTRKNKNNETDLPLTISSLDGLIDQRDYFNRTIASKDMSGYYLLKKGEFAYNKSYSIGFDYGSIKRLDKYEMGALSTLYICFKNKDNEVVDPEFLSYYFDSQKWCREVYMICTEGARHHGLLNVGVDEFFNINLCIPKSIEEQRNIAKLFKSFDQKIEVKKDILSNLKEERKTVVSKIFDKTLYSNAEWKKYKLRDALVEYNEKSSKGKEYEHVSLTKEGVVPKTERYDRDFLVRTDDKKYRVTHVNDICYNPANLKFGVICRNKYKDAIFSPIYVTFKVKEGFSPAFIELLVTRTDFINYSLKYQEGTVYERMAVSPEDLLSIDIEVPNMGAQEEIAHFVELLDEKIREEEIQLNSLLNIKKGLLQTMFV